MTLRQAFRKLDKDHSGYLSRDEIIDALDVEKVGLEIPVENILQMLMTLDEDTCSVEKVNLLKIEG